MTSLAVEGGRMAYRDLALLMLAVHFGFLAYVIVGGFLTWRWPRSILAHGLVIAWAVLSVSIRLPCPLTGLQNWARLRGHLSTLSGGFIDGYVRGTLYPADHERLAQLLIGLVVLVSWVGYVRRRQVWRVGTRRKVPRSTA